MHTPIDSLRTSYQETSIKFIMTTINVRIFHEGKDLSACQTYHGANKKVVMVCFYLGVGHCFWLIGHASVKYITQDWKEIEGALR